jgi:3-oxoacyl-[acyl-carrier protein] reductase
VQCVCAPIVGDFDFGGGIILAYIYVLPVQVNFIVMDEVFKKIIGLAGVKAARLARRVPTAPQKLTTILPKSDILEGISVAIVSPGKCSLIEPRQSIISGLIKSAGGNHVSAVGADAVQSSIDAVICDTRGMKQADELKLLHTQLHSAVPKIARNGRLVMITGSSSSSKTNDAKSIATSTIASAVHGFAKSMAKELSSKAITVNTVRINDGVDENRGLPGPVQFLLSKRSAFITGQILTLTDNSSGFIGSDPKDSFNVQKKRVLITGASRGIGEYTARLFHAEGAELLLLDHPSMDQRLREFSSSLGCRYIAMDVSHSDAPSILRDGISKAYGNTALDVVIHNAGITRDKTFGKMSIENFSSVIDVNLAAVMKLDDMLFSESLKPGAKAVYLSSISGIAGTFGQTNYSCSKAGIMGYVAALGADASNHGIGVNAIAPGFIETEMTKKIPFLTRNVGRHMNALLQGGYPADVAEAILFLSSPASAGVNGNTIRVCGGHMIGA